MSDTNRKLKLTEKLAFGLAGFPEAANSILAAFLTMFYTDSIGMAAGAVGTMFLISKLFDGMGSAITSFSQKISSGLAMASVGWILGLTGYVQNQVQSSMTNNGIIAMTAWIPIVVQIIIFLLLKFCYKYDEIAEDVITELDRRKQEAAKK